MNKIYHESLTANASGSVGEVVSMKQHSRNSIVKPSVSAILFILALITSPLAHTANLLFKSNFGSGVSLAAPASFYTYGAWQSISGTDKETGYSWPIKALGADFSGIQLITIDPVDSTTIGNYITNEIRQVTGPDGNLVNELFQNVKIKGDAGIAGSQAPLLIKRPFTIGDVNDLYITYWFKFQADFLSRLTNDVPDARWRQLFAFKTGGYLNDASNGDYRASVVVLKGLDGNLYWQTKGDNVANGPWARVDYWTIDNHTVAVPIDKWFKFEIYWHRSGGSDGRFWAAVDGQVIADHSGPNMGDYNLPINRIFVNNAYSGGYATVESHSTGLEMWDGFPCGNGVSCFNADSTAPTVPTSLASTLATTSTTTSIKGKGKTKISASASVALSWGASSDNIAVAGYNIYRNGTKIAVSTSTNYTDSLGTATGAIYSYTVKAFDAAGNISTASNEALIVY